MEKTATQWMIEPLRKYGQFRGRARRAEFWWFYLFTMIVGGVGTGLDAALGLDTVASSSPINSAVSLAFFVPTIATGARRLHDTNHSGWWQVAALLAVLPLIAGVVVRVASPAAGNASPAAFVLFAVSGLAFLGLIILLLVWLCTKGTDGPNRFGDDPLGREDIAEVFS